jgi:hypothetical protein
MKISNLIRGGFLQGRRTYLISAAGILSALASYMAGDINLFEALNSIYPMAGIYFLRKGIETKRNKNANTRKISRPRRNSQRGSAD